MMKFVIYSFVISVFLINDVFAENSIEQNKVRYYDFRDIGISLIKDSASQGSIYGVAVISYGNDKQTDSYYKVAQSFSNGRVVKALLKDSSGSADVFFNGYEYGNAANEEQLREIIRFGIDNKLHLNFGGASI